MMSGPNVYTVISEQNDHDCTTVRAHPRNETFHVVEYADEDARSASRTCRWVRWSSWNCRARAAGATSGAPSPSGSHTPTAGVAGE